MSPYTVELRMEINGRTYELRRFDDGKPDPWRVFRLIGFYNEKQITDDCHDAAEALGELYAYECQKKLGMWYDPF